MKEVLRNFNDIDNKYKMEIATKNIKNLSDAYRNDLGNLANFYIFHAMEAIDSSIPKILNRKIYNEKSRTQGMSILYGLSKALEFFNNEKMSLSNEDYQYYLDLMKEEVYNLKTKNMEYKGISYDSGETLEESDLFIDVLNTNRKLISLELDKDYVLKNISSVNQEYYNFISIVHDLINQNMIMMSRIKNKKEENIEIKKK